MEKFKIKGPYITLGQFVKAINLVSSGGMEKVFLLESTITYNGEPENRRGKKIYPKDRVNINGITYEFL
ncbi:MAG: S4 domain-containing protein YaaA [Acholeplasmataceae bacterium]|nr:S4 domain-containing protein YaaA [Acholeplasmataceae bacterium]